MKTPINILFLCTGNSARSILSEVVLNTDGAGKFRAYSAGSKPAGAVNALALSVLEKAGYPTENLRSKNWDEFAGQDAVKIDIIITVCDNAASEVCPVWPGHPLAVHWGLPDPAAVEGPDSKKEEAFEQALHTIRKRLGALVALDTETLDGAALKAVLEYIIENEG